MERGFPNGSLFVFVEYTLLINLPLVHTNVVLADGCSFGFIGIYFSRKGNFPVRLDYRVKAVISFILALLGNLG